ncbi:hypothetical protein [Hyphomicrobium sp.]|uniref:hypothetical protein n=1 Tax=Hyphomicrobium sp. TaxID=82 RepID=UPI002FDE8F99
MDERRDESKVRRFPLIALATAMLFFGWAIPADASGTFEILSTVRTSHRAGVVRFRIPAHQSRISELSLRSGSLAMSIAGLEIAFADGGFARIAAQETVPAGHQSRAFPVDGRRAVTEVVVTLRPGLRQGDTVLQLLGRIVRN